MPFTNYGLDKFVAQEISALSECKAPDLAEHFAEVEHWIPNFILNSIFRVPIEAKYKPYIFLIIRRVQMALVEYQNGRSVLLLYLNGSKENISLYFQQGYLYKRSHNVVCRTCRYSERIHSYC